MTRFLPFVFFFLLIALLLAGLGLQSRGLPSPLVGKAAPSFSLPLLQMPAQRLRPEDLHGQPWLLNVWASWCGPCRAEHPILMRLAGEGAVIIGLNYKDAANDAVEFLQTLGDPYRQTVADAVGDTALNWGVYGVPETFVIDAAGVLRYKHVGPLAEADLREHIRPLLVQLREEAR